MLVLMRKPGEEIVIPQLGVTISLLDVRGGKARIGITTPVDVAVHRAEAWACVQPAAEAVAVGAVRPQSQTGPERRAVGRSSPQEQVERSLAPSLAEARTVSQTTYGMLRGDPALARRIIDDPELGLENV